MALSVARDESGGADITLVLDGQTVASGKLPRMLFMLSSIGMDLGRSLAPVCEGYSALTGGEVRAQARAEMSRQ